LSLFAIGLQAPTIDRLQSIDYHAAVSGGLNLVPRGAALATLSVDYALMVADGLLLDDAEKFDVLIEHCRDIEMRCELKSDQAKKVA
jgi:hypothetical protein